MPKDSELYLKRASGITLFLAIWATVFVVSSYISVAVYFIFISGAIFTFDFIFWSIFYTAMSIIFYKYRANLVKRNVVSTRPYLIFIIVQLLNPVYIFFVNPANIEILWFNMLLSVLISVFISFFPMLVIINIEKYKKEMLTNAKD